MELILFFKGGEKETENVIKPVIYGHRECFKVTLSPSNKYEWKQDQVFIVFQCDY